MQMRRLFDILARVAPTTASVLISGESGTGKELVARAVHDMSLRCRGAFVPINCAAIPRDLLESELFGHRKGAFSGAIADRKGRFELASGGTIFLDEIGDMPLEMQAKLLRVLQEGTIEVAGGQRPVPVDVRVVAATHRNLESECSQGRFREDLFHRLNVLPLAVPALRERSADIPELVAHFAKVHLQTDNLPIQLDTALARAFVAYAWPGNVRELSNVIFRLSVLYPGQRIESGALPAELLPSKMIVERGSDSSLAEPPSLSYGPADPPVARDEERDEEVSAVSSAHRDNPVEELLNLANGGDLVSSSGIALKDYLALIEKRIIQQTLAQTGGNVSKTAQLLSLQRTTLIQKLHKLRADQSLPAG